MGAKSDQYWRSSEVKIVAYFVAKKETDDRQGSVIEFCGALRDLG